MSILLKGKDLFSPVIDARITFHMIRWGNEMDSFTLKAGGNILFHQISADTQMHVHDFGEICLILKGKIKHYTQGQSNLLEGPIILFIRPHDEHYFEQFQQEVCELVNFAFHLNLLEHLKKYLHHDEWVQTYLQAPFPPMFKISRSEAEDLSVQLLTINTLEITNPVLANIRVRKILLNLFTDFFYERVNEPSMKPDIPEWLNRVCNAMKQEDNLRKGLTKLIQLAGRTPEHVCASFRKYLHKTPTEYLNELRIHRAARLLLETDEKIISIAYRLGFRSQSRFYAIFKQHYNISPARYRNLRYRNDIPLNPG